MSAVFVTSSGTEIGKTHVSAILCHQLRAKGRSVLPLKPVLSGFEEENLDATDSGILLAAAGQPVTLDTVHEITPWRFAEAISPDMAAAHVGREIAFQPLIDFCKAGMAGPEDVTLIEGAGGVHAPINSTHRMFDMPRVLDIPALLVVGSYLGTISHTITAFESLERHGVSVAGIVMSESEVSPVPMAETKEVLSRFLGAVKILLLPRLTLEEWQKAPDLTVLL